MEGVAWENLAIQIPVVIVFSWVILKIFFKTKEFVEAILNKHELFLSNILTGHQNERETRDNLHKSEREIRDKEWREWLTYQRESYLQSINNLTDKIEEHHKNSIAQASEIVTLLNQDRRQKNDRPS